MKAKKVLQNIRIDGCYIQEGTIIYKDGDVWKPKINIEHNITIPSYINLEDKKYFEDWIETKFEVDNLIIYKRKTYKITKIYQFNGIRKNTFTRFKVVDINNPNLVIELNETEINNSTLTKEYFFIDSKGKIQKTYEFLDSSADTFRKIVKNFFYTNKEVRDHLQKLLMK